MIQPTNSIQWLDFSEKHSRYILNALDYRMCVAEGAIRSGKTIDHCIIFASFLEICPDKIHLASGSTIGNAKLNIGVCNGYGLEYLFRGRCRWGKYRDNEALYVQTQTGEKIVLFAGGGKADSYKRILGNSYGGWIATEINEHYDSKDSRTSFIKVAMGRQTAAQWPLTLWDLNPCGPNHPIYTNYIDAYEGQLEGGYLYEHFTMFDNLSITDERREEITRMYQPGTVWYERDILGKRKAAEGLIYKAFADDSTPYIIDDIPRNPEAVNIGVDFGGNESKTAFITAYFTGGFNDVVIASEQLRTENEDPAALSNGFADYVIAAQRQAGADRVLAFADSAEQILIRGLRTELMNRGNRTIVVRNALKGRINNRIHLVTALMAQGRFKIHRSCETLVESLQAARFDEKKKDRDERLDDGSYCVDILDAMEYAVEPYQSRLLRGREQHGQVNKRVYGGLGL